MRASGRLVCASLLAVGVLAACSPVRYAGEPTPTATSGHPSPQTPHELPTAADGTPKPPLSGRVIVIDPGHNGGNASHLSRINRPVNAGGFTKPCNTTGTETGAGYPEHAFTFTVASRVASLLRERGARVVLTRKSDHGVGPCVNERGLVAAHHHADLLLSIHGDGAAPSAHGFTVLRPARRPHYTADTYRSSRRLARAVADAMARHGFDRATYLGKHGIEKRRDLGTLNRAHAPAVMVECGNMRNTADARMMSHERGSARIASALTAGVTAFILHRS